MPLLAGWFWRAPFVGALLLGLAETGSAVDYEPVEFADWNAALQAQNWRVLLVSRERRSLGAFLDAPAAVELPAFAKVEDCGIGLVTRTRKLFTSPPVPPELVIFTHGSRSIAPPFDAIMQSMPTIDHARVVVRNPRWTRLMTSETTSILHASAVWGNPSIRAQLIQCVQQKLKDPIVDSVLEADLFVSFHDRNNRRVNADQVIKELAHNHILFGALISKSHRYSIQGVTMARRFAVCTNTSIFFRSANGQIGAEICQ